MRAEQEQEFSRLSSLVDTSKVHIPSYRTKLSTGIPFSLIIPSLASRAMFLCKIFVAILWTSVEGAKKYLISERSAIVFKS